MSASKWDTRSLLPLKSVKTQRKHKLKVLERRLESTETVDAVCIRELDLRRRCAVLYCASMLEYGAYQEKGKRERIKGGAGDY